MIYLIRHGQASFSKKNYDELSDMGILQSETVGDALKSRAANYNILVGGSLNRHQQTANHSLRPFNNDIPMHEDARWNEYDHMELLSRHNPLLKDFDAIGQFLAKEDNPMRTLQKALNDSIYDWIEEKYTYKQPWKTFKSNVWNAINEIAIKLTRDENAWIFTSGGPIAAVLLHLLRLEDTQFIDLQGRLVNTSITKVHVGRKKLSLSTYNDYSHLEHDRNLITYR